jgi:rhodanese-related sulfurtransferase
MGTAHLRRLVTIPAIVTLAAFGVACGGNSDAESNAGTPSDGAGRDEASIALVALGPDEFARALADRPDALVVNVHVPYEGEIAGTEAFIPYDTILDDPQLPADKDAPLLLYCMSDNMSEQAGNALIAAGYTDVTHLDGGMQAWQASGRDLTT